MYFAINIALAITEGVKSSHLFHRTHPESLPYGHMQVLRFQFYRLEKLPSLKKTSLLFAIHIRKTSTESKSRTSGGGTHTHVHDNSLKYAQMVIENFPSLNLNNIPEDACSVIIGIQGVPKMLLFNVLSLLPSTAT